MDRLSELPDSVIFHIFWLLPMNEVVRTTILSKRWLNLWTTTPFLNFDESKSDSQFSTTDKFRHFVHQALLCWDGVKVLKLKVVANYDESGGDVDLWVRFAKKYEVEELYLHSLMTDLSWTEEDHQVPWVPLYLYSCSSLKMLSIENCYFRIKGNVQWNQLKSLRIINCFGVTEDVINQILRGSPQLEVLTMSFEWKAQSLCIRSTSLKELSIYNDLYDDDEASTYRELSIWTPNLKALKIKGIPYNKCLLMNVSSLTHATIEYSYVHWYNDEYCDKLSMNHIGDLFGQILPSIQHVENVTLLSCCVKVLGAMIERCMNSSSPNVKSLRQRFHCSKFVA
ncbi:F-box/LRR-repeat protein At3g26922-like isoform X4 [Salvia miltiorrhiza]|uniref:F-box/LRR-repeat protein At3g26922-like isoform X4 n=1 Tax=Salvia miltiorrhiza TaxID=226208 RepID=UPI0025AC38F8|nr:F-box/LRR-repeat protein At3g26922-like isoform X4 [Salvia miltiorrhiza]